MLTITKNQTITGTSIIEGIAVETYIMNLDSDHPEDMTINSYWNSPEAYKKYHTLCYADRAEFEEMAFKLQEELEAEIGEKESEEDDEE